MIDPSIQVAAIIVAAVTASWLADRLRIPSILPLLVVGVLSGPVFGLIDPDEVVGDLLAPLVSMAVGIILFEGGLSLRTREIEGSRRAITGLVTVGVAVTWIVATAAGLWVLDLTVGMAAVLGAILVVSGPTVVGPVLHIIKPSRQVWSILKWESIFIDPVGAMLAVITFDVVIAGRAAFGIGEVVADVLIFTIVGIGSGAIAAAIGVFVLRRHWVGEHLISLFGLALALASFSVADAVAHESGLLATTVLGVILANHHRVRTEPLVRFSEVLRVLLIGVLFIVLSARLTIDQLASIGSTTVVFILVLVLIARPAATWISTFGSDLDARHKGLIAGVAPRGIVAASIASVFGLELERAGVPGAESLTPVVFAVIVATVVVYGLGAGPLARMLGLARPAQEGVLILGAGPVERAIGSSLAEAGIDVILATVNRNDERIARMQELRTFYGNILDDEVDLRLELSGIGRLMALTPNDEINALAARRFSEVFGGAEVFQLPATPPPPGVEGTSVDLGGRPLFAPTMSYDRLRQAIESGGVRKTALSPEYGRERFLAQNGPGMVPLGVVRGSRLLVGVVDAPSPLSSRLQPGDVVVWVSAVGESSDLDPVEIRRRD